MYLIVDPLVSTKKRIFQYCFTYDVVINENGAKSEIL